VRWLLRTVFIRVHLWFPNWTRMSEVTGLTKLYGEFVAVNELSFSVQPGEVMCLVGPNGAGKTTTLRCLAGIIPPTRGALRICGDLARDPIPAKQTTCLSHRRTAAVRLPHCLAALEFRRADLSGRELGATRHAATGGTRNHEQAGQARANSLAA
jgi:ABC-type branched-subunit amino acid transport system ATPase component